MIRFTKENVKKVLTNNDGLQIELIIKRKILKKKIFIRLKMENY